MVLCPGIGEKKVKRLHRALHAPFMLGGEEESKELDYVNSDGSNVAFSNEFGSNATSTSDNVSTVKRPEAISGTAQATGSNFMVPPHPSTIGKEQRGKVFDPSSCAYVDRDRQGAMSLDVQPVGFTFYCEVDTDDKYTMLLLYIKLTITVPNLTELILLLSRYRGRDIGRRLLKTQD